MNTAQRKKETEKRKKDKEHKRKGKRNMARKMIMARKGKKGKGN